MKQKSIGALDCVIMGESISCVGSFLGHQSILFAELMAMFEGLDPTKQLEFPRLEVESDSVIVWFLGLLPLVQYSTSLLISLAGFVLYPLVLLLLSSMPFRWLLTPLTSRPNGHVLIRVVSDSSAPRICHLVCLAFFIWILSSSHMFDVDIILLFLLLFVFPPFFIGDFSLCLSLHVPFII